MTLPALKASPPDPYPGSEISPAEMLALASEYHRAAHLLKEVGRKGRPLSWAPFRLAAIHAIELYLSARLRQQGVAMSTIRGFQHDMDARTRLAQEGGLVLRARTAGHLSRLTQGREYLIARYGPERLGEASQLNRLTATLGEVAGKVVDRMGRG